MAAPSISKDPNATTKPGQFVPAKADPAAPDVTTTTARETPAGTGVSKTGMIVGIAAAVVALGFVIYFIVKMYKK
jgi:hypothetical protein